MRCVFYNNPITSLRIAVSSRLPLEFAASVWLIPEARNYLQRLHLEEMIQECENVAKYTRGHLPSVMRDKSFETMRDFGWKKKILTEDKERCLTLLDVVTAICWRGGAKYPEMWSYADYTNWNNLFLAAVPVQQGTESCSTNQYSAIS